VLRWLFFDNHKFTSYFATYRFMKAFGPTAPDPAVMTWLRGRLDNAFGIVDKHLHGREFLVGSGPTIGDISLCGYLFYPADESGYPVQDRYPLHCRLAGAPAGHARLGRPVRHPARRVPRPEVVNPA
jgi:glutathione S-transferase